MDGTRTTARDIRRRNRSALLTELFFHPPMSRMELGVRTGLSSGTVSTLTAELLDQGLIEEAGQADSDGGRPRTMLRVNAGYGTVVGVDVGETGVLVEVFDLGMTRLAGVRRPLPSHRPAPEAVADQIAAGVGEALAAGGSGASAALGVGIGLSGTVGPAPASLVNAPAIGWRGVDLAGLLRARDLDLPLFLDNGAKTFGQAELLFGAVRGARHAVVALVGSGVGVALVTDGRIYRGAGSAAGEWGHLTVALDGRPCRCGSRGCLEAYAGAEAVLDRYRELGGVLPPGTDEVAGLALLLAAAEGTAEHQLLLETARLLGLGIANLLNLLNPERVVVGGWAGIALAERLLPQIVAAAREYTLPHIYEQVTIELCALGPEAVAFGAATLPVTALLANGDPRTRSSAAAGAESGASGVTA
jgi:predicted NBD/HSP70 family sugar kinase